MQDDSEQSTKDAKAGLTIEIVAPDISRSTGKEPGARDIVMEDIGVSAALAAIFSWKNYRVYLATAWIFSAASIINLFFTLYVRAIGWDYTTIGMVIAASTSVSILMRIAGGYIGDTVDRKKLAVFSMALGAMYFLILGLFTELWAIVIALFVYASIDIAKGGSSAYILDNIPREHSGLGLSLFTAGRVLGVVTLICVNLLLPFYGFPATFRLLAIIGGLSLVFSTGLRTAFLDPCPPTRNRRTERLWKDFLLENGRTIRTLLKLLPGAIIIITLDAFSDSLFNFGALLYANEYLGISINSISIMLATVLLISVPLLLKIGRLSDRWGIRKSALVIYSVMPLCMGLLVIAPQYPIWAPQSWIDSANAFIDGLGVIYTTVFLAIVLKRINDGLWWLIVTILIQKNLPHKDTAKFLAAFWYIVYIFMSLGPLLGGYIFTYLNQPILFLVTFIINITILVVIYTRGLINEKNMTQEIQQDS
ncbi:MAG: MFS transporter [Candidatus Thorarchaeota archaeon]|nr:MFS transporter [Candidatus Thorarchaeota archaeon]